MELVTKFWLEWLMTIAASGMVFTCRVIWKKQKATEMGVRALLRDRLVTAYYKYTTREYISLHGLEAVESMYKEYHNLGGNGTVTKLVNDMRAMEVRDD